MSLDTKMRNEFEENADRIGYKRGYAAAIADAAKVADKYATEYVFSFAQVAKEIRALLSKGTK